MLSETVTGDVFSVPPMSDDGIAVQPTPVWRCVEDYLSGNWRGRVRSCGVTSNPPQAGWLTLAMIPRLEALGAPARAAFMACALVAADLQKDPTDAE